MFALFVVSGIASAAPADARNIDLAPNTATNVSPGTHTVTANVTDEAELPEAGVTVTFTETGVGTIITADADPVAAGTQVLTDAAGNAVVQTQTTTGVVGTESITGSLDPATTDCELPAGNPFGAPAGNCTETVTKTWQGAARNVVLTPETATNASGTIHSVVAKVTDVSGAPVAGTQVTFTETGTGVFVANQDDASTAAGLQIATDASGEAEVFTTTIAGQEGDQTVTGDIANSFSPTGVATANPECARVAGDPVGAAAGDCADTAAKTWGPTTPGVACTITGTDGDDVLEGTEGADVICGLAGNDSITGLGGNDTLRGGAGNDTVKGGAGDDLVRGGAGNDALRGGPGNDTVKGGGGNDNLKGGSGNDALRGGRGTDTCRGGPGNDSIRGCEL
jgi:Ca2+-binding RTX toxin-like protein